MDNRARSVVQSLGVFSFLVVLAYLTSAATAIAQAQPKLSDSQIRQILIDQSKRSYSGSCPCPYDTMRNGRSCGGSSAYSKPGGASPLCYPQDVSDGMVRDYRRRTGQ